jgi:hypothetical protein
MENSISAWHRSRRSATSAARTRANVSPAAAGVLADRDAPSVVRERAFAVLCVALAAAGSFEPTGEVARTAA